MADTLERQLVGVLADNLAVPEVEVIHARAARRRQLRHRRMAAMAITVTLVAGGIAATSSGGGEDDVQVATAVPRLPAELPSGLPTPSPVWTRPGVAPDANFSPAAGAPLLATADRVYGASGFSDSGWVIALDSATGETVWTVTIPGPDGGKSGWLQAEDQASVVVNRHEGAVMALDRRSGDEIWTHTFGVPARIRAVAPVGEQDWVAALSFDGEGQTDAPVLEQFSTSSPNAGWRVELDPSTQLQLGRPYASDGALFVQSTPSFHGSASNVVHAIDLDTGTVRWRHDLGTQATFFVEQPFVGGAGLFFARQASGGLVGLDMASGDIVWKHPTAAPIDVREGILFAADDTRLLAMEAATGTTVTAMDVGEPIEFGTVTEGIFVVATRTAVVAIDVDRSIPLGRWTPGSVAVEGGPTPTRKVGVNGFAVVSTEPLRVAVATDDMSISMLDFSAGESADPGVVASPDLSREDLRGAW